MMVIWNWSSDELFAFRLLFSTGFRLYIESLAVPAYVVIILCSFMMVLVVWILIKIENAKNVCLIELSQWWIWETDYISRSQNQKGKKCKYNVLIHIVY